MACSYCADSSTAARSPCPVCGATISDNQVVTLDLPVDTTGLPAIGSALTGGGIGDGTTTLGPTAAIEPTIEYVPSEPPVGARGGALRVGQSFGSRYHIIKVLGVGGMGAVYQAWDGELNVGVALKVIRADAQHRSASPVAQKRFKQELLLARQVTHKNVVRIHDLGEIDGIKYITMPYVHGADLATVLRRTGKLPVDRALRFARQIAGGLQAAHEAGVIHRDLKPANVMIGADDQALIMDFGISASTGRATGGGIVGTLEYMAPEQGKGEAVDGRADIYAFGLILYEMLAGPRPTGSRGPRRDSAQSTSHGETIASLPPCAPRPTHRIPSSTMRAHAPAVFRNRLSAFGGFGFSGPHHNDRDASRQKHAPVRLKPDTTKKCHW